MCTSFVYRGADIIVANNFDHPGQDFKLALREPAHLAVLVNVNGRYFPSFGVTRGGTFINDLMVEGTEAGRYKRASENRWTMTTLVENVLTGRAAFEDLPAILAQKTIVDNPAISTHAMIVDPGGSVYVVEPGRGHRFSPPDESSFFVMSNFPLCAAGGPDAAAPGAGRYHAASAALAAAGPDFGVDDAFAILEQVQQRRGDYPTRFSMVALPGDQVVYCSIFGDFDRRFRFSFADGCVTGARGVDASFCLRLGAGGTLVNALSQMWSGGPKKTT